MHIRSLIFGTAHDSLSTSVQGLFDMLLLLQLEVFNPSLQLTAVGGACQAVGSNVKGPYLQTRFLWHK